MPRITVQPYTPALAADFNAVSDQTIMRFGTAAQRSAAIPAPTLGMHTFRDDAKVVEYWDGVAWVVPGDAKAQCLFSFYRSVDFTLGADGWSNLSFDAVDYDPAGTWFAGGGDGSFKAPRSGWLMVLGRFGVSFSGAQQGNVTLVIDVASSPPGGNPWSRGERGSTFNGRGDLVLGNSDYGLNVAAPVQVTQGAHYAVKAYVAAPGLSKVIYGGRTNTYMRGFYVTP